MMALGRPPMTILDNESRSLKACCVCDERPCLDGSVEADEIVLRYCCRLLVLVARAEEGDGCRNIYYCLFHNLHRFLYIKCNAFNFDPLVESRIEGIFPERSGNEHALEIVLLACSECDRLSGFVPLSIGYE